MASLADPKSPSSGTSKFNFPGPLGSKRRRMRSGGNVSTQTNNTPITVTTNDPTNPVMENISEQKTTQTSKCKGATTIPIFLKKTYKMIDTSPTHLCSWSEDGDMFVVKDPDLFASQVIPQYFDHNKFSSFARQLNFYGFRKMQSKPIRNSDFDAGTAKHVTFFNENFKRGRCDLLKKIQRSTRGAGATTGQDQSREVSQLRDHIRTLEAKIEEMEAKVEERVRRLELDMLSRIEQMMLTVQHQQQANLQLEKATSVGTMNSSSASSQSQQHQQLQQQLQHVQSHLSNGWDPNQFNYPRGSSISSAVNSVANIVGNPQQFQQHVASVPTLPPHPKQKLIPLGSIPGSMAAPPDRMNSLRGISTLSRGISGVPRGASVESSASAVLMRNSWEDKFFSMLMLDDQGTPTDPANLSPTPIHEGPVTISETSGNFQQMANMSNRNRLQELPEHDDLSDVSNPDM